MTKKTTLHLLDQVNCKFSDLDPMVRRDLVNKMKFQVPYARHMPAVKLGRWDGKVSFATVGGGTFIHLLDRVLPIVMDAGYEIEIDDQRPALNYAFPEIDENVLSHKVWPEGHPAEGQPIVLRDYQVEAIKNFIENPQSLQQISTGAGKCCHYDTEIEVEIDENSAFGQYLINTLKLQERSTGAGRDEGIAQEVCFSKLIT